MKNILIFGDSIVAGRGISKSQSWVSLLTQLTDSKDKKNTLVYNLGVPGESTKELLKRFKTEYQLRTQKRSPEDTSIIVISVGINDSKGIGHPKHHKTPPKNFHQNIHNLIKISTQHTSKVIFIGLTPVNEDKTIPLENNYFLNSSIKKYNNIIKIICGKTKIPFVEIFEDWIKKDYKKYLSDDGVHLNELGHKKIFEKVAQLLISNPAKQFDPLQILKKEYSLSNTDIKIIKSH